MAANGSFIALSSHLADSTSRGARRAGKLNEETPKGPGASGESTESLLRRYEAWRPRSEVARGMFDLTTGRDDDTLFIAVSGELDYSNVDRLDKEIRAAEKSDARRIVVSLRD